MVVKGLAFVAIRMGHMQKVSPKVACGPAQIQMLWLNPDALGKEAVGSRLKNKSQKLVRKKESSQTTKVLEYCKGKEETTAKLVISNIVSETQIALLITVTKGPVGVVSVHQHSFAFQIMVVVATIAMSVLTSVAGAKQVDFVPLTPIVHLEVATRQSELVDDTWKVFRPGEMSIKSVGKRNRLQRRYKTF